MILRLLVAKAVFAKLALTPAFTAGAGAGPPALAGACAARRALRQTAAREAGPAAT
jgi:hypothetical protein